MESLGMMDLEPILRGATRGEEVNPQIIEFEECKQDELVSAAVQYGRPFDLVAKLPRMIFRRIEDETVPKIEAQIESRIQPRMITLMFSVLGFLSLIVAVLSLLAKFWSATFIESAIMSTYFCVVLWAIVALTGISVLLLVFKRWALRRRASRGDERALRKYFGGVDEQFKSLKKELKRLIDDNTNLRNEICRKADQVNKEVRGESSGAPLTSGGDLSGR